MITYTHIPDVFFDFVDEMQALGMESGAIADSQITAASEWSTYNSPKRARLYTKETDIYSSGAWSSLTKDLNQWLQVYLGKITSVTHVATQGRDSEKAWQWVKKYNLQFSDDGASFVFYKRQGESSDAVNRNLIYQQQPPLDVKISSDICPWTSVMRSQQFPLAKLAKNCQLQGTDRVQGQLSISRTESAEILYSKQGVKIYRGYYTVARRYAFYVRVARTISHE